MLQPDHNTVITPTEKSAIEHRQTSGIITTIIAIGGLAGVNIAPEHAQVIGTIISLLLPFTPSVINSFKRR
jgi:hypothetical protein